MTTDSAAGPMPDAGNPTSGRDNLVNRVLAGRYELLEVLGEGPLLAAYRSRDRVANKLVTVKTLLSAYGGRSEIIRDLKSGIGQTISLNHPSIARVYDVGTDDETGLLFLVEEYVRGIDLKERIRRVAPLQLSAATDTAIFIVEALEAAHARGIAHGDLRPQNVLIGPDGQVKVTGFGIANAQLRVAVQEPQLMKRVIGYIAPDGERAVAPTTSGDLYAVGVILYEMLTGDVPYSGETALDIGTKHAKDVIPSPRVINAGVPIALDGIVRKALGKTPEERYSSTGEMLKDLRNVRDALRYGRPLNWSPLDTPAPQRPSAPVTSGNGANVVSSVTLPPEAPAAAEAERTMPQVMPGKAGKTRRKQSPESEMEEEYQAPRSSGVGRWLTFINLLLALTFLVAAGYLVMKIMDILKPSGDVVVPNLVKVKLADAETMAIDKKFKLEIVAREVREKEPKDMIYQQNIAPGRKIKEGKAIGIWVSRGPRMVEMPDVTRMSFSKARLTLENRGLKLGKYTYEYDTLEPRGNVVRQVPLPDENVARGTAVDVVISRGEAPADGSTPGPEPTMEPEPTPEPTPTGEGQADERYFRVEYEVPDDGRDHRIRVDVSDEDGARTISDEIMKPGSTLKRPRVRTRGAGITIKVFDDDQLVSELNK